AHTSLPVFPFLSRSRAPRDLHSFPTRRSSDLGRSLRRPGRLTSTLLPAPAARGHERGHQHNEDSQPDPSAHCHPPLNDDEVETRSEEHTSELQSRENLVCRLLLEKKKRMKIPN